MSSIRRVGALSAILLVSSCFSSGQKGVASPVAQVYDDPDAYAVYDTLLPDEWSWKAADGGRLVIQLETVQPENAGIEPSGDSKAVLDPLVATFNQLCRSHFQLKSDFHIQKSYDLVPEAAIFPREKGEGGWPEFYRAHPNSGGYLRLSPVAFNRDRTIAMVYIGHSCGLRCGGGAVHLLQKQGTTWIPLKYEGTTMTWAS